MDQTILDQTDMEETYSTKRIEPTVSQKLKKPESEALKQKILNFIRNVQQDKYPKDQLNDKVCEHIESFENEFQELWREPEDYIAENGEAIEKIVMKPLHNKIMPIDATKDKDIEFALKTYDFVKLEHLEVDELVEKHSLFLKAVDWAIVKIDELQTPKEKLTQMVQACKLISQIVNQLANCPTGADNFLPALIYATLKAQPKRPWSNLLYIGLYRLPKRLRGQDEYYFTAYQSSLEFISTIDANRLKISKEEFRKLQEEKFTLMKNSNREWLLMKQQNSDQQTAEEEKYHQSTHKNYINLQMIKVKLLDLQKKSKFYEQSKKLKLKFAQKQLSEITLSEVGEFHQEYQQFYRNLIDMQKDIENLCSMTDNCIKECLEGNQRSQTKRFFGIL